ncbi:hypothetical protein HDV00_012319 [Rhizophlyctis rosea]|nr:hypothetical protein HDV00_012319 [Rhizophlyctis rosea]
MSQYTDKALIRHYKTDQFSTNEILAKPAPIVGALMPGIEDLMSFGNKFHEMKTKNAPEGEIAQMILARFGYQVETPRARVALDSCASPFADPQCFQQAASLYPETFVGHSDVRRHAQDKLIEVIDGVSEHTGKEQPTISGEQANLIFRSAGVTASEHPNRRMTLQDCIRSLNNHFVAVAGTGSGFKSSLKAFQQQETLATASKELEQKKRQLDRRDHQIITSRSKDAVKKQKKQEEEEGGEDRKEAE